jgi:hypothetical protein
MIMRTPNNPRCCNEAKNSRQWIQTSLKKVFTPNAIRFPGIMPPRRGASEYPRPDDLGIAPPTKSRKIL